MINLFQAIVQVFFPDFIGLATPMAPQRHLHKSNTN